MQKKMDQQCHCEGAAGDCGNLKPRNTKTVYFLRRNEVLKVRRRREKAISYARPAQNMRLP